MSDSPLMRVRDFPFRNDHTEEVPAFGIIQITGTEIDNGVILLKATRPTTTGKPDLYFINGPTPVPAGRLGRCTQDVPYRLLIDDAQPAPTVGDTWGPQANSYKAKKGPVYWTILSDDINGTRFVGRAEPSSYVGKSSGGSNIAAMSGSTPGTGTLAIYGDNGSGGIAATAKTVAVVNTSTSEVDGSKWLHTKQERETGLHLIDFEDCAEEEE